MYADGVIGNHGLMNQISKLVSIVLNYIRQPNSAPYTQEKILGSASDYLFPPATELETKANINEKLLSFISQAPGFNKELFEKKHG